MNKAINHRNVRLLIILIFSILCFAICFKSLSLNNVYADNPTAPKVIAESKTVHRGQTFSVDVDLSDNEGLISLYLTLDYDESVMTLKNIIKGSALDSLTLTTTNVETEEGYGIKPFNMLWDGKNSDSTNGTIITFIFDSYADAPIGQYPITLTYDRQNTNIAYQTPIDVTITSGVINLIAGEYQAVYRDYNGEVLFQKDYNGDEVPSYPSSLPNPTRNEDAEYSYEFIGFKGVVSNDINVLIFEADYKFIPKVYTIFYYIDGIKNYPDGIIDQNEDYFFAEEVEFGAVIQIPQVPEKQYYQFFGWYIDESFSTSLNFAKMPSREIRLYGYYLFDVRERNIPVISLQDVVTYENSDEVIITANMLINTGLNGLILTLNYDSSALTFEHFENLDLFSSMQFDTTNIEHIHEENFKFYYESSTNNFETGDFLKLYFRKNSNTPQGTYIVSFEYDFHTDTTYIDNNNEIKYTKVDFINAEVPVGEINHWVKQIDGTERAVDITSENGKPINVYLEVELVTQDIVLEENDIESNVGYGKYVSSAYQIKLMQNRREIEPNTLLTIRIKLTEKEQKGELSFYYLNDNNELISHEFTIEDDELVFTTDHLSNWVIFNTYTEAVYSGNMIFLVGFPILLAIATMLYVFRLKQRISKKEKEAHND